MESLSQDRVSPPLPAVVIGGSAGGIRAACIVVSALPADFRPAVVVVLHQMEGERLYWPEYLGRHCALPVLEAEDKMPMAPGTVYCAPAGYHLMMEDAGTFSLSLDERVHFARPSIDVLFSSASDALGDRVVGVILTGANSDGADGLRDIVSRGGRAVVQSPSSAEFREMPEAALRTVPDAIVADLEDIAEKIVYLSCMKSLSALRNEVM